MAKRDRTLVAPVVVERHNIVVAMYALDFHRLPRAQQDAFVAWQEAECKGSVYDYLPGGKHAPAE